MFVSIKSIILGFPTYELFLKESFCYFKISPQPEMLETHSENVLETMLAGVER